MPTSAERAPRRSLFATHRGRAIKRVLWVLGGLALLVMVLDGVTSPDEKTADAAAAAPGGGKARARVAAAPADPFKPYRGVNDAAESDSDDGVYDPGPSGSAADGDVVDDVSDTTWSDMLTVAQNVATAYSTYDYRGTPEEYAASLPSLSEKFRKALGERAASNWPVIKENRVVSKSSLIGTAPDLIYYRESAGAAQIAVSVAQTTTSAVPGAEESSSTRSVVLVLDQTVTDEGSAAWVVTDIIT